MSDWKQTATPHVNEIEQGRNFAPEYDTELTHFDVSPVEWAHLCSARFGDARPCDRLGNVKWTGNCFRYDIFTKAEEHGRELIALRWWNGSGEGWLVTERLNRRHESNILDTIAAIEDEARRWDMCHFLWQTAHKTALAAERKTAVQYQRAFVEKRIKKQKIRGKAAYRVTIED